ncbi:MAG: amidohydrolase [Burkholderiales bacterium]
MYLAAHPAIAGLRAWQADLTAIRHALHATPELGFEEHATAELVVRQLERYGVDEIHRGLGKTGVVGVIRGRAGASGRTVGLRADMDALPMAEENDFAHRSTVAGRMHACGHDGHTAMLLGAARWLAKTREFDGTVHLIFQPGEEGYAGARAMIQDGLFERFPCDAVYAMHNWPGLEPGTIAVKPGPMMAAAERVLRDLEPSMGAEDFSFMLKQRQAVCQSIDVEATRTRIMRGAGTPTNLMIAPGVNGFVAELNKRPPYDPEASKKLLADAGYPSGFEVRMNCPNDLYVNDGEICQAVAGMLARVGIKINLEAESKATYFPKILSGNTSFDLLGWTPTTYDAHNTLYNIMATPQGGQGVFNLGSWSNARFDELTTQIGVETDQARRNAMIAEAMKIHAEDFGHVPLNQQALAWGLRKHVSILQRADNIILYRTAVIQ